jgi:ERCC4-type nuclease
MATVTIVAATIDSREPKWVQALGFNGAMTTVTAIDHGDLLVIAEDGSLIAVERKTVSDFLGSVKSGRVWPQLAGMRKQTKWCYLVICGRMQPSPDGYVTTKRGVTGWPWASIQGALLRAQELGAMIVWAASDEEYEATVMGLSNRGHEATVTLEPVRLPNILSAAERILVSLPGIGLDRVGDVLDYANTAGWALTFLTDTSHEDHVIGIGPGIKRKVRAALGLHENEILSVIIGNEN